MPSLAASIELVEQEAENVLVRRSLLHRLVKQLSIAEIRSLRDQLNGITFQKDILSSLPVELLLCVVSYLELDDILTARSVSATWNFKFTSVEVCLAVIKLHFRPIWEQIYAELDPDHPRLSKENINVWLRSAAARRLRRLRGLYRSSAAYSYNETRYTGSSQYSNGRVANRIKWGDSIVVTDLREEHSSPRIYVDEQRHKLATWLLSDQYLLGLTCDTRCSLTAWRLASDPDVDEVHTITVPNIQSMAACHDRAVLNPFHGELLTWKIGGAVKSLDLSRVHQNLAQFDHSHVVSVGFHPRNHDVFFVIFEGYSDDSDKGRRIVVQLFNNEQPQSIYTMDSLWHTDDHFQRLANFATFRSSAKVSKKSPFWYKPALGFPLSLKHELNSPQTMIMSLTFDFYTQAISTRVYHIPYEAYKGDGIHCSHIFHNQTFIWQDQMHIPFYPNALTRKDKMAVENRVLIIDSCDGRCRNFLPVATSIIRREHPNPTSNVEIHDGCDSYVAGDEEFVVLSDKEGYEFVLFDKVEPPM